LVMAENMDLSPSWPKNPRGSMTRRLPILVDLANSPYCSAAAELQ